MGRTPVPPRVDTQHLRALIQQRRDDEMLGIWLSLEDVEALCTEAELYRLKSDAAARRQKDGVRTRRR
jgi:hypothetical protein